MILPARSPLEPYGRPLRALYVALNRPVVTLESLPPGPATAAVALHDGGASVCLRSLRSSTVQLFVTGEELASDRRVALDAALSFAESMGFLFDDDEVEAAGDAGPEVAARHWRDLCGEEDEDGDAKGDSALLLDVPVSLPRLPLELVLSKFRRAAAPGSTGDRARSGGARLRG
jgi:hypothetical protein